MGNFFPSKLIIPKKRVMQRGRLGIKMKLTTSIGCVPLGDSE